MVEADPEDPTVRRKPRVLVIDDDEAFTRSVARVLRGAYDVKEMTSALEALGIIRGGERFVAIAVDMHMTEMSGVQLHELLLQEAPDQAERLVLITGDPSIERHSIPADRVLSKPVPNAELKSIVARLARSGDVGG